MADIYGTSPKVYWYKIVRKLRLEKDIVYMKANWVNMNACDNAMSLYDNRYNVYYLIFVS